MTNLKRYLIEIGKYPLLTAEEEKALATAYKTDGDMKAREKLINSNLRLVVKIANQYQNAHLTAEDLIMEGNQGLLIAVEKYNPELGYKFSTCAVPWIKQSIGKAIVEKGRNIRTPAHIYQLLAKYRAVINDFAIKGIKPTDGDIAKRLGIEVEKIADLKKLKYDTLSLDAPLGEDGEDTIGDLQADGKTETPTQYVEKNLLHDKIISVLKKFKPRNQQIIKLRYGIKEEGDGPEYDREHTLEEIGEIVGITRERVRQIEKETLLNMKMYWEENK